MNPTSQPDAATAAGTDPVDTDPVGTDPVGTDPEASREVVRLALTESINAYRDMPVDMAELARIAPGLATHMADIRSANITHGQVLARAAAERGAHILCFGELFTGPYFALTRDPMWRALAEDARTGPTVSAFRATAAELGLIIIAPIYELVAATGACFNTAVVIDEHGQILGLYRKTHIPEGENEQAAFCETFYYRASDGELGTWPANRSTNRYFPVFETSRCNLGVAICYDRHFEGVMSTLAAQGAELVVSPAVTFGDKSQRMWHMEFAVDAARHSLFIAGSNRRGQEPPWNQPFFGQSHAFGPNGLVPPVPHDGPDDLLLLDLDLDQLRRPDPSGWNLARDRRPDIY